MTERERLTTEKRKIFAREDITIMSMTKDELRQHYNEMFDRLQEYEVAEENGYIIVLPCKIGDVVYTIYDDEIKEGTITNVMQEKDKKGDVFYVFTVRYKTGSVNYSLTVCEEYIFLSREEAEKALSDKHFHDTANTLDYGKF